jgi:hypothetical protein
MASKDDVRVTNVPSYLRTRVKLHDSFIISDYKKAHPTDPAAGSIARCDYQQYYMRSAPA